MLPTDRTWCKFATNLFVAMFAHLGRCEQDLISIAHFRVQRYPALTISIALVSRFQHTWNLLDHFQTQGWWSWIEIDVSGESIHQHIRPETHTPTPVGTGRVSDPSFHAGNIFFRSLGTIALSAYCRPAWSRKLTMAICVGRVGQLWTCSAWKTEPSSSRITNWA